MEAGNSVLFVPAYRLGQELLFSKRDLDLPRRLRKLDNFDLLLLYERYERRSLGITSSLAFSQWEHIFANPMATATAIDRVVHHSVILEFDVPSYRTNVAQQRGQSEEVNRQNWSTPNRQIWLTRDGPSVVAAVQSLRQEPGTPLPHRRFAHSQLSRCHGIGQAVGAAENDSDSPGQRLR